MALTKVTGQVIKSDTNITSHNINSSGIITAVSFSGPLDTTGGNFTGIITATSATFSGNVTIGGTLTYEDVTNIDSLGILTARNGLRVTAGGINVTAGVSTYAALVDVNNRIDVVGGANIDQVNITGVSTFAGDISIADKILHTGDTNTAIRFSANDTFQVETGGSARLTVTDSSTTVTGDLRLNDNENIYLGDGADLEIRSGGNDGVINQANADLKIQRAGSGKVTFKSTGSHFLDDVFVVDNIVHDGDTDTLIRFPAADQIQLDTGGTNYLKLHRYASVNFVEIGASASISLADNGANTRAILIGDGNASSTGKILMQAGAGSATFGGGLTLYSHANSTNEGGVYIGKSQGSSGFISFGDGGTSASASEYLRINSGGQVLIGTDTNPAYTNRRLTVATTSGTTAIEVRSATNGDGRIYFTDNTTSGNVGAYAGKIMYDHTDNYMSFYTGGDDATPAERLRITSGGSVGVGLTNPDLKLHVNGTNALPATSGSTPAGHLTLRAKASNASHGMFMGVSNASPWSSWIQAADANNLATEYPLLLNPNGGYVGINTTTPSRYLHIVGNDGATGATIGNSDTTLVLDNKGTNGAMIEFLGDNNGAGHLMFTDTDGVNRGRISYHHNGDYIRLDTAGNERLKINSDGRVMSNITGGTGGIGLVGAFMARPSATYDTNNGLLKITLGSEEFDANGWFDTSNSRYTPLCKGWYQFNFYIQYSTNISGHQIELFLYPYKNGAVSNGGPVHGWDDNYGNYAFITFSTMIYMNGSTDYIEMYANCSRSTKVSANTRMSGFLVHPVA